MTQPELDAAAAKLNGRPAEKLAELIERLEGQAPER